jgi:glucose/arabinose dehydrogenase
VELVIRTGYPDLSFLIDHQTSGLTPPDRNTLLQAKFEPLSGAARMDVVPGSGSFREFRGNIIVALNGDRSPFATSGYKLAAPVGYKVVRVDPDTQQVKEFVHNTRSLPSSMIGKPADALERPIDVKFGPDGAMYILDLGRMEVKGGHERIIGHTGKILRLVGAQQAQSQP